MLSCEANIGDKRCFRVLLNCRQAERGGFGDKTMVSQIKNISEVTEPLKEQILKGDVHTIEEMRAWLQPFGYSVAIKDATISVILREFVMREVSTDNMMNMDMVVERLRPQPEVTKEYKNIIHLNIFLQTSDILPGQALIRVL